MSTLLQFDILDNLEIYFSENSSYEFPDHYHEEYAFSLVLDGVYVENGHYALKGDILISKPFEIHKNKNVGDGYYSLLTFYVNSDVLKSIYGARHWQSHQKVIRDPILFSLLYQNGFNFINQSNKKERGILGTFEKEHLHCLNDLIHNHSSKEVIDLALEKNISDQVKEYIDEHISENISLEGMEQLFNCSKYKLIRAFKLRYGITPFQYIVLNRILKAKNLIAQGCPIVDAALRSGFYDQSHFHKYFQRYYNTSPGNYKKLF